MRKKTYQPLEMNVVIIHASTPLLTSSNVMGPGPDNNPPGSRSYRGFKGDDSDFLMDDDDESQF